MAWGTTGSTHLELTAADGVTPIPLMLVRITDEKGAEQPYRLKEALSAADADSPLAEWLEPEIQETWIGGCGGGKDGYAQAPGVDTRFDGYAFPGPAANPIALPATNNSSSALSAIVQYGSDIWVLQEGGNGVANQQRVMRATSGTTALADSLLIGTTVDWLTDLMVFDNGSGTKHLWASGNDTTGGRLHHWDGTTWTSTASGTFGANRRDWLAKVFWKTPDGKAGWRMIAGNGNTHISYTKPDADPTLAASWIEAVPIETAGMIRKAATARRHAWFPSADGLFDMDEEGTTPNLAPYFERQIHAFNGYASLYHEDWVYLSAAFGMERVWVGDRLVQESPGQCGPGAFTGAEHEFGGWVSCLSLDQGWIVAAVFNPNTQRTGIWWGRDRKHYPKVDTPNPMVWHGPLIHSTGNQFVTSMQMVTNLYTSQLELWVGSIGYNGSTLFTGLPTLTYFTLPIIGQPLSDLLTGGRHKFADGGAGGVGAWQPYSHLHSSPKALGDSNSKKIIYQTQVASRGLNPSTSTRADLYVRADPAPGSIAWGVGVAVTAGPTQAITPTATTAGYQLGYRIDLFSPLGAATPPQIGVLDAVRIDAWRVVPSFPVLDLDVQYGPGASDLYNGEEDTFNVERIGALLKGLTESDRTALRMPDDNRYTVKLRQVKNAVTEYVGGKKRVTATLQAAVLAGPL